MAGYIRQDVTNDIDNGKIVDAADLDAEFDAIVAAFNNSTGHTHDGTSAEGAPITFVGPVQDLQITAAALLPKTTNTLDLGSASFQFKSAFFDGTVDTDDLVVSATATFAGATIANLGTVTTADINGGTVDGTNIGASVRGTGAFTTLAANNTVTFTAGGSMTGTWSNLGSVTTIDINGGTIDSTVIGGTTRAAGSFTTLNANGGGALTGTWTNLGSVTTVDINGGTVDGTTIGGTTPAAGSFTTISSGTITVSTADNIVGIFDSTDATSGIEIGDPSHTNRIVTSLGLMRLQVDPSNNEASSVGHTFEIDNTEHMRLTSSGLAVKTGGSASATDLQVGGTGDGSNHYITLGKPFANEAGIRFSRAGNVDCEIRVTDAEDMLFEIDKTSALVNNYFAWRANGSEIARLTDVGNLGIGETGPSHQLEISNGSDNDSILRINGLDTTTEYAALGVTGGNAVLMGGHAGAGNTGISFRTSSGGTETQTMFLTGGGTLLVAKSVIDTTVVGGELRSDGLAAFTRSGNLPLLANRLTDDGTLVEFRQDNTTEGTISVSGTTVSYNGGHLSRWSRLPHDNPVELYKGTVMTNLEEMVVWEGEENEQLNYTDISDVEGDPNVAGLFVAWDESDELNDYYLAMTGDMIVRIAPGEVVQKGDLLMSAGGGCAKPQGDDIVRSKTIAKVTSPNVTYTYPDGSYAVPCVVMAC